jgi:hypothetical protein
LIQASSPSCAPQSVVAKSSSEPSTASPHPPASPSEARSAVTTVLLSCHPIPLCFHSPLLRRQLQPPPRTKLPPNQLVSVSPSMNLVFSSRCLLPGRCPSRERKGIGGLLEESTTKMKKQAKKLRKVKRSKRNRHSPSLYFSFVLFLEMQMMISITSLTTQTSQRSKLIFWMPALSAERRQGFSWRQRLWCRSSGSSR